MLYLYNKTPPSQPLKRMCRGGEGIVTHSRHCAMWSWSGRPRASLGFEMSCCQRGATGVQLPTFERSTQQLSILTVSGPSPVWGSHTWLQTQSNPGAGDGLVCLLLLGCTGGELEPIPIRPKTRDGKPWPALLFAPLSLTSEGCGAAGGETMASENARWASGGHFFFAAARVGGWEPVTVGRISGSKHKPVEKQPVDC
jgi:hypothetical protein